MKLLWDGGKFAQTVLVTWPRWPPCPYMVKNIKNLLLRTKRLMTLKLGMHHRVLEYYKVCSNDDPGLTMTYFMARSNMVPYAVVWETGKTMDFSETIVVYDLKLATDDRSDKKFLLTSKLCPLGAVCPVPGLFQTWKRFLWNLQQMGKVIRTLCLHQNFVPWGLSAPAKGLYTCIKSWKKMYKLRLQRFVLNL